MRIVRKLIGIKRTAANINGIDHIPRGARLGWEQPLHLERFEDRNVLLWTLARHELWIDHAVTEVAGDALKINGLIKRRAIRRHGSTTQPGRGSVAAKA